MKWWRNIPVCTERTELQRVFQIQNLTILSKIYSSTLYLYPLHKIASQTGYHHRLMISKCLANDHLENMMQWIVVRKKYYFCILNRGRPASRPRRAQPLQSTVEPPPPPPFLRSSSSSSGVELKATWEDPPFFLSLILFCSHTYWLLAGRV